MCSANDNLSTLSKLLMGMLTEVIKKRLGAYYEIKLAPAAEAMTSDSLEESGFRLKGGTQCVGLPDDS